MSDQKEFSPSQLDALKNQIMVFKLLSSNLPVPLHLQQTVLGLKAPNPFTFSNLEMPKEELEAKLLFEPYTKMLPAEVPFAYDPLTLAVEREHILKNRIQFRINELENLPNNLPHDLKLKAMIELKALKLSEYQRKLREEILRGTRKLTTLETSLDRSVFKKYRKQSIRETRLTEKLERQQKLDRQRKEKQRQTDLLQNVLVHAKEFMNFHKNAQLRKSKVVKAVANYHANYEREEMKRLEKLAKDRLKALKADDEEAYLKLIDQQKDTRLTHLLRQTDEYLDSLTSLVRNQQTDYGGFSEVRIDDKDERKKADYYGTAHRVKEVVADQPKILTGGTLKDYQIRGLEWMVSLYNNHLNGILADEMGLGKTIQAISLIAYLMEKKNQSGPFLIIVPLSTMTNWSHEFERWAPGIVKIEYKGVPSVRKSIQNGAKHGKFNVMLTTYEYIIKDRPFLSKIKWLYMIIDEGHRMKNLHSKLTVVLTQHYYSRYRLILTGTPLQNNLPELWALLNFVLPKIFNSSKSFDDWFNTPFANTGEKIELNEEEELLIIRRLHKVLRPFLLRRMKKDVESELPDKVEMILKCPMSSLQSRLYEFVKKKNMMSQEAKKGVGMRKLNNTIMQLRKICNHPFIFEEVERQINPYKVNNELLYRTSGKFELLSRILGKFYRTGHRILIFFQMTQIMTIMEDFLNMYGYKYLRLDGSTKADDRADLLKKFNDPNSEYFIFLLSTRAGGLGLNLQTADTVIFFDSDWNPHQDLQAQDRAHRIGQTKEVRIFRLVTIDSVEEYILERAQFKLNIDGKVIQAGKFDQKSTNEERDAMLRALFESNQEEKNDVDEIYNDEELNEIICRNEAELELFRKMDEEMEKKEEERWKKLGKPVPARLIERHELPEVYVAEFQAIEEDSEGDGRRQRKSINYVDDMSEDQWLDMNMPSTPTDSGKQSRKQTDSFDSSKRIKFVSSPSSIFHEVLDVLKKATDKDGRVMSEIFMDLPSKDYYPDYYVAIKKPISINIIEQKAEKQGYSDFDALSADLFLMFDNAMTYNVEGSQVYDDACALKKILIDHLEAKTPKAEVFSEGSNYEEESEGEEYEDEIDLEE